VNRIAAHLDGLGEAEAIAVLTRCCASTAWARAMARARPFGTDAAVFAAADRIWAGLTRVDYLEAFAGHPRIGERAGSAHAATAKWSSREQAGMDAASAEIARALAEGNAAYEAKFGHVFLICATGRSAAEMLAALRARMEHTPEREIAEAAEQQRLITRIRLERVVDA
jgi:2-oxo-4-hydroxy-4-carboxy-5-ureidoimidazoline decarboxylase